MKTKQNENTLLNSKVGSDYVNSENYYISIFLNSEHHRLKIEKWLKSEMH